MVIREVESDADRQAVQQLLAEGFEMRPGVGSAFADLYLQVKDACSFLAVVDRQIVGHALLAMRSFVMGDAEVLGGIVAMVIVDPRHRGQGIGGALIHQVEQKAHRAGALLLHVAGDPLFYMRFGFVPAYVQGHTVISVSDLNQTSVLRPSQPEDVRCLANLSKCEIPSGAVVADEARWQWVLETNHPEPLLARNDRLLGFCAEGDGCLVGDDIGFVRGCWREDTLAIYESACCDKQTARQVLRNCAQWASQLGCREISLHLPPNNRLMRTAVEMGASCKVWEDAELQVKLLNTSGVMVQCEETLKRRSKKASLEGILVIRSEDDQFELNFGGSTRYEVFIPEIGLVRALLGTDRLADRMKLEKHEPLCGILDALFPVQEPFFWVADSF